MKGMKIMKKVLVVTDPQNDFINGILGSKEAMKIVPYIVNKIRNFDGIIIITLDTHNENYLSTSEGKKLQIPHCIRLTNGWLPNKEIMNALKGKVYIVIEKNTFGSVNLISEIQKIKDTDTDNKIEIEFVGYDTEICVVSNVLVTKTFFPEDKIIVDKNGCVGVTHESHNAALLTMKMCQIDVVGE